MHLFPVLFYGVPFHSRYLLMKKEDQNPMATDLLRQRMTEFDSSEFARLLGLTVAEARDGYARVVMPASGKKNPNGVLHGGAVFTLADHAFGIAANTGSTRRVAVSVSIQFIAPAHGDLEAIAQRVGGYSTYRVLSLRVRG
jgi:acyl-CoA thioesterase